MTWRALSTWPYEMARLKRQLADATGGGGSSRPRGATGGGGHGVGGEQTAAAELEGVIRAMEGDMLQRDDAALGRGGALH